MNRFLFILITLFGVYGSVLSQSFLPIKQNNLWGFVDSLGNVIVEPQYQNVGEFNGDYCTVCEGYKCGVLHKDSGLVVPVEFNKISNVGPNTFLITTNDFRKAIFKTGQEIDALQYYKEIKQIRRNRDEFLFYDERTDSCILSIDGLNRAIPYCSSVYYASYNYFKLLTLKGNVGAINMNTGQIIFPKYRHLLVENDSTIISQAPNGKYGIHQKEKIVLPHRYDFISSIGGNVFKVQGKNGVGYFNVTKNRFDLDAIYESVSTTVFDNEVYYVVGIADDQQMILSGDLDTLVVIPNKGFKILNPYVVLVMNDSSYQVSSNRYGLLKNEFDLVSKEQSGFFLVKRGAANGLVNKYGKLVLPPKYQSVLRKGKLIKAYKYDNSVDLYDVSSAYTLSRKSSLKNFRTLSIGRSSKLDTTDMNKFSFARTWQDALNKTKDSVVTTADKRKNRGRYRFKPSGPKSGCLYNMSKKGCVTGDLFAYIECEPLNRDGYKYTRAVFPSGRVGLVSSTGNIVASVGFENSKKKLVTKSLGYVSEFNEQGIAVFNVKVPIKRRGLSDYKAVIKKKNERSGLMYKTGLWGVINEQGQVLMTPRFKNISDVINGKIFAQDSYGKYGVINLSGDTLVPFKYDGFQRVISDGKVFYKSISIHEKWEVFDPNGEALTFADYDRVTYINQGYSTVRRNKKWTVLDPEGNEIIPPTYERMGEQNDGLIPFRDKNLWGYLDTNGDVVIEPQYDLAGIYSQGLMPVKKGGSYGIINDKNEWVIEPKYTKIIKNNKGLFITKKRNRVGVINDKDEWIVPHHYEKVRFLGNQYIQARNRSRRYDLFTLDGTKIYSGAESVKLIGENHLSISTKNYKGTLLINKMGEVVIKSGIYKRFYNYNDGFLIADSLNYRGVILDTNGTRYLKNRDFRKLGIVSNGIILAQGYRVGGSTSEWNYVNIFSGEKVMIGDRIPNNIKEVKNINNGLFPISEFNIMQGAYLNVRDNVGFTLFTKRAQEFVEFNGQTGIISNFHYNNKTYANNTRRRVFSNKIYTYSMINGYGFDLAPMIFKDYKRLKNGYTIMQSQFLYGVFDANLNEIVDAKYESVDLVNKELLKVYGGGQLGYFNILSNSWIWELQD